ncbi:hypothetical protein NCS52_01489300 [Fusarium sp. LHS14.1]|nr:hypothetical protein NCS52_01489300 [Fusarium sp. LHS14.1]
MQYSVAHPSPTAHDAGDTGVVGPRDTGMSLRCNICDKVFSRSEHLVRHENIHLQENPIECKHCGKAFGRKDSAKRHELLHMRETSAGPSEFHSASASLCRTCSTCAKSRVKCSGGTPCKHCATRNLDCVYLPRKRRRIQYGKDHRAQVQNPPSFENLGGNASQSLVPDLEGDSSRNQGAAGVFDEASPEPSLATNWLPFDISMDVDLMLPSPENILPAHSLKVPIRPASAAEECETSTIADLEESQGGVSFVLQQQSCVSALISSMGSDMHGYADYSNSPRLSVSPSSAQQTNLYVDGAGFRSSQAERCIRERQGKYGTKSAYGDGSGENSWQAVFSSKVYAMEQHPDLRYDIPEDIFEEILSRLCPSTGEPLLSEEFLANKAFLLKRPAFSVLLKLYFTNFHKLYPFVDHSFLCIPIWGWSLTLAVAAIGTRYMGLAKLTSHGEELCAVLHELLLKQLQFGRVQDSLPYIQARMLAVIGLCQSRQPHLLKCGHSALALATNSCLQLRLLDEDDRIGARQEDQSLEQTWIAWRFRETRRRTGIFIWLTDCLFAFATENPPTLPPQRLKLRLPSSDDLWEAETAQGWLALAPKYNTHQGGSAFYLEESMRESVQDATQKLWRGHPAPDTMTQFSTFIVLHMLLRRRWDTSHYLTDSMTTVESPSSREPAPPITRYVGEIPAYVKWRNCICDCLDLLHWQALSASAKGGAYESPVFLQLHLARLVILAPVRELLDHVSAVIQLGPSQLLPHSLYHVPDPNQEWGRTLLTWAYQDRFKARLAIIHAGAVLWHTRRYSAAAFIEPYTIFLATLILWAFGMASSMIKKGSLKKPAEPVDQLLGLGDIAAQNPSSHSVSSSEPCDRPLPSSPFRPQDPSLNGRRMPHLMQLDRPMDDELVQHFIRSGDGMHLSLEGVDDLCSVEGPWQVLHEGIAVLLAEPKIWTITESYASTLVVLATTSSAQ